MSADKTGSNVLEVLCIFSLKSAVKLPMSVVISWVPGSFCFVSMLDEAVFSDKVVILVFGIFFVRVNRGFDIEELTEPLSPCTFSGGL